MAEVDALTILTDASQNERAHDTYCIIEYNTPDRVLCGTVRVRPYENMHTNEEGGGRLRMGRL